MASQKSFFFTGANAKIKLNGRTVAFATDISYRIIVRHGSPRVLGRFEVEAHVPLSYDVEGSFSIIKYASNLADKMISPKANSIKGSGIGSYGLHSGIDGAIGGALGLPHPNGQFDGKADEAFIPSRMFQAKAFEIEIIQKVPVDSGNTGVADIAGAFFSNPLGTVTSGGSNLTPPEGECVLAKLEGCRITEGDFKLNKRSVATQTFTFKAQYAHEDTFIARKSGVGQELS